MKKVSPEIEVILRTYTEEVKGYMTNLIKESKGHATSIINESKIHAASLIKESRDYVVVLKEDFQEKLQVVAEGVSIIDEKLERFNSEIREEMKKNHGDMLFGFKSIRDDLKKKVDYDQFVALERRVDTIESKLKH